MSPSVLRSLELFCSVLSLFCLTACSLVLTRPSEPALEHQVRFKGETVSLISSWYTGTPLNAKRIRNFNDLKEVRLVKGQEILIPRRLLVRTDIIPMYYILAARAERQSKIALAKEQSEKQKVIADKEAALALVDVYPTSIIKKHVNVPEEIIIESRPNEWIRQELERDAVQESIVSQRR